MAETNENLRIIRTIICLRSDSQANLEANGQNLVLRKGEMCITIPDNPKQKVSGKVGTDGKTCWADLPYSFGPLAGDNSGSENPGESGVNFTPDGKVLQLTKDNILTLIGADTATAGQSFKISEDGTSIVWFETADKESVVANKTAIDLINESLEKDYYNKTETDALFSKVFVFKGTVTTKEELDAVENPEIGWVYIVKGPTDKEGQLYVYAEDEKGNGYWEDFPLAIDIDLSGYVLTTDFDKFKEETETRLTDAETKISEHTTLIERLQGDVTSTGASISGILADVQEAVKQVDGLKTNVNDLDSDVTNLETRVDTLEGNVAKVEERVDTLDTTVTDLKTTVDDIKENGIPSADLTELTEKVNGIDEYVESVKPTINSLPDTLFSAIEAQTLQNGDIRFVGTHINKDTDGSYNIGGESILTTLKAVTPNGNPGLMTGADKAKLDKLFDVADNGGQPNVIETIRIGGEDLEVNEIDKSVNIPIGGEKLGVVKNYTGEEDAKPMNTVEINEDGTMRVPEVHVESLVADDDFILNGGTAGA